MHWKKYWRTDASRCKRTIWQTCNRAPRVPNTAAVAGTHGRKHTVGSKKKVTRTSKLFEWSKEVLDTMPKLFDHADMTQIWRDRNRRIGYRPVSWKEIQILQDDMSSTKRLSRSLPSLGKWQQADRRVEAFEDTGLHRKTASACPWATRTKK